MPQAHSSSNAQEDAEWQQFSSSDAPPAYSGLEGTADQKDEADWELDDAVAEHEGEDEDVPPGYDDVSLHESHSHSSGAISELGPVPSSKEGKQHYVDKIVASFMQKHPLPANHQRGQLPSMVIIPQRRPHAKRRGFVRAYAPVLENCGIDQETFLNFLKSMLQSSKASPVFQVINIAALIVGAVPSISAIVVSSIVNVTAMAAIEVKGNQPTNDFLPQMNEHFFKPRGLFCLNFAYKPESQARSETVDISPTISHKTSPTGGRAKQTIQNSGRSAAKTYGEVEMPEAAALIFPALDVLAADEVGPGGKNHNIKRKGKFVADYFDKRAQAAYMSGNPGSTLAAANPAQHNFASRDADPNHPANSGSSTSLLTGGNIDPKARQQQGRGMSGGRGLGFGDAGAGRGGSFGGLGGSGREDGNGPSGGLEAMIHGIGGLINKHKERKHEEHEDQQMPHDTQHLRQDRDVGMNRGGRGGIGGPGGQQGPDGPGLGGVRQGSGPSGIGNHRGGDSQHGQRIPGLAKRVLTENVLYLMIVNMPTDDEMAAAKILLEERSK